MTHSIEYVDDLNRQLKSLKKENDELKGILKEMLIAHQSGFTLSRSFMKKIQKLINP